MIRRSFGPKVSRSEAIKPISTATITTSTHSISTSTQTDDWNPPAPEVQVPLLQAPSPVKEESLQDENRHYNSSSKPSLTQEQVDAILEHAKNQDRRIEQDRIDFLNLKKQFKRSEDLVKQLRSTPDESLNAIACWRKTVEDSDQKHRDEISKIKQQSRKFVDYYEGKTDEYKARAKSAEGQLDSSEKTVTSLHSKLREKTKAHKMLGDQSTDHRVQLDQKDREIEHLHKKLQDVLVAKDTPTNSSPQEDPSLSIVLVTMPPQSSKSSCELHRCEEALTAALDVIDELNGDIETKLMSIDHDKGVW